MVAAVEIIKVLLYALIVVMFVRFVPVIQQYIGQKKIQAAREWANDIVLWAEGLLTDEDGRAKFSVAKNMLNKINEKEKLGLTDEQMNVLIESMYQTLFNMSVYDEEADFDYEE